jgi:hypothetical protein
MPFDSRHLRLDRIVGPFAEMLLATDLPQLPAERRADAVRFIQRRTDSVPSFTRFGVTVLAFFYRLLLAAPFGRTAARLMASRPFPVLGEYPRLIRSLGYAYIWERWPDTLPTGAPR